MDTLIATQSLQWYVSLICVVPKYADVLFKSLKAMGGATYNSNPTAWKQQTQKHCGLEARVTDPSTGKSMLMYIGDSFDDAWVKVSCARNGGCDSQLINTDASFHRHYD